MTTKGSPAICAMASGPESSTPDASGTSVTVPRVREQSPRSGQASGCHRARGQIMNDVPGLPWPVRTNDGNLRTEVPLARRVRLGRLAGTPALCTP